MTSFYYICWFHYFLLLIAKLLGAELAWWVIPLPLAAYLLAWIMRAGLTALANMQKPSI